METSNRKNIILLILLCLYSAAVFMFNGQDSNIYYVHLTYGMLVFYLFGYTFLYERGLLRLGTAIKWMIFYIIFSAVSILWSPMIDTTVIRLEAIGLLFLLCVFLNNYTREQISDYIIVAIIVGGLCEAIYCIQYYGISTLIGYLSSDGYRLEDTEINNVNSLSNTMVIAVTATISVMLFRRMYWISIVLIPETFIMLVFSSRTAFIALAVSVVIIMIRYRKLNQVEHYSEYYFIRLLLFAVIGLAAFKLLTEDSEIISRFDALFSFMQGNGEGKASSLSTRSDFIKLGWQEFLEFPIGGRGFGCAGYILKSTYGYMTYLHNNYIEILASGGIIGFVSYYGCYCYLFIRHLKIVKNNFSLVGLISFITLCTEMITQIGIVTYYSKVTWLAMALWVSVVNEADYGTDEAGQLLGE